MTNVNYDEIVSELKEEIENTHKRFYKAADHVYSQASVLRDKVASLRAARIGVKDLKASDLIRLLKDIDNAARDVANAAKLSNFPADKLYHAISKAERSLPGSE